jgi:hypothetical protein
MIKYIYSNLLFIYILIGVHQTSHLALGENLLTVQGDKRDMLYQPSLL